jgi:hypothetical protein
VITSVFEVYGAFCVFSLIAFLILASVAKLRPDLDEEELDFVELEKLAHSERSDGPFSLEPPIIEKPFWSQPPRPVKQSKRQIPRRPHLIHVRKPRIT